jgi:hypothetical protein
MRTKYETIDIYHEKELPFINTLLVYAENEYGSATSIAAKSVVGDAEPDARIVSHLITNTIFNQTEGFEDIGWELYIMDNVGILNITNWPATPLMPLEEAEATWIYAYPPARDTLLFLSESMGVKNITYMSATTIHEVLQSDIFKIHNSKELITYDFINQSGDEDSLFLSPPTWLFGHLSKLIGFEKSNVIMSGYNSDTKVDAVAARTLSLWIEKNLGLIQNVDYGVSHIHDLNNRWEENEKMKKSINAMINKASEPENQMLWG